MFLLLFFGMPIISNAAGVYDSSLINVDKEKVENIKTEKVHILNDKTASEYDIALLAILKKHTILQKMKSNTSNNQNYSMNADTNNFIHGVSNDEIDAQILFEAVETWKEIKNDLNYINILLNRIDIWTQHFLYKNVDPNLIFVLGIDETVLLNNTESSSKNNKNAAYKNQNFIYANGSSSNKGGWNGGRNGGDGRSDFDIKENVFSLIYLWGKYSDIITGVLIIAALWLLVTSLISILVRQNR
jgi:hypothetical protein